MSSAPMGTNPKNMRYGGNQTRPSGASSLAESLDPRELLIALDGNRQSRRLAVKNAKKLFRNIDRKTNPAGGHNHA